MTRRCICMTAYNRPKTLERTLQSLSKCDNISDYQIILSLDGGEGSKQGELLALAAEFPELDISTILHKNNVGCAGNTGFVLENAFSDPNVKEIIFLDDTNIVSKDFLTFLQAGLDTYRDDPTVFAIGAYNRRGSNPQESSYSLCDDFTERGDPCKVIKAHYFICAGWAIWRRIWEEIETSDIGWFGTHLCSHPYEGKDWMWEHIGRTRADPTGSWAFPFNYYWRRQRAVIAPDVSRCQDGHTAEDWEEKSTTMEDSYAHTHVYSEYWMGDGVHKIPTTEELIFPEPVEPCRTLAQSDEP